MFDGIAISKYLGVTGTIILSGFGAPIPEEIPVVTAGAIVGHDAQLLAYYDIMAGSLGGGPLTLMMPQPNGTARWWIMLPAIIVAIMIGDSVLYLGGRWWGTRLLRSAWVQRRILPPDKQKQIESNFHKNGILILLGARLTPGIRTPVFLMAGVLKMPYSKFLLADGLYAVPGVNLLFWLAYLFTDQFVEAVKAVDRHRPMAILAVLSAIAGIILYKFVTSRHLSTGDPQEIAGIAKPVGVVTHAVEQTIERTIEKAAKVVDVVTHPRSYGRKHPPDPTEDAKVTEVASPPPPHPPEPG